MTNDDQIKAFKDSLKANQESFRVRLTKDTLGRLSEYFRLVMKWNPRLHLVSPSSANEFSVRHILESLWLLHHLPQNARVADVGSGAGLPLVPCLLARTDLDGILIESSAKKGVFLREALKLVERPDRAQVITSRFELIPAPRVDFVTSRALDSFQELLPDLIRWAPQSSRLLLFGGDNLRATLDQQRIAYRLELIPNSEERFLFSFKRGEEL
jgi:16S rRNA (guanine527-N7)-methyltransferase